MHSVVISFRKAAPLLGLLVALGPPPGVCQTIYVVFGDSITAGDESGGYPPRLERLVADSVLLNRGSGGERTPEGLTRIDDVLGEGGDVLLLMEGTNDISRPDLISNETTLFNLGEMARKAEDTGLEAIHATLIPRLPNAKTDRDNFINQDFNQNLRDLAGNRGRRVVDNWEVFSGETDLFARLYDTTPTDPVGHPNPQGYDLMAGVFADVLNGLDRIPPVPGIISPNHGDVNVSSTTSIVVDVWDFGAGLDSLSADLTVNGVDVQADGVSDSSNHATLTYTPATPLDGLVRVGLRATDTASLANSVDREIARFIVGASSLIDGDINLDGRVDGGDLIRLALAFGKRRPQRGYDPRSDLNNDAVVDGMDLAILASNFGRSG